MSTHSSILSPFIPWDSSFWIQWHQKNWTIVYTFVILYVLSARIGAAHMSSCQPFDLRKYLARWNMGLAVFSILGAWITGSELFTVLSQQGFSRATCDNSYFRNDQVLFWNWLWTWSKLIEFGDTIFIVLRKRPLTFLHVYHHAFTALVSFYFWHSGSPINRWTVTMNFIVHSIMYTYFAIAAIGLKLPKPVALFVTLAQILQMIVGCITTGYILYARFSGLPCKLSLSHDVISAYTYISYSLLFIHLFYAKYLRAPKSRKSE